MIIQFKNLELDNKKIILIVLSCVIVLYLDLNFILRMQLDGINNLKPKIAKLSDDLSKLDKGLSQMQEAKNKPALQKISPKTKKIISEDQMAALLQQISDLANGNEIKIIQIKPLKEQQPKQEKAAAQAAKFIPYTITLDLVGDYHHFGKFVNDLENGQNFISVYGLNITSQQNDYFKQKINLILRTYVTK